MVMKKYLPSVAVLTVGLLLITHLVFATSLKKKEDAVNHRDFFFDQVPIPFNFLPISPADILK